MTSNAITRTAARPDTGGDRSAADTEIPVDDRRTWAGTRLSFVRHAQSLSNATGRIQGERICAGLTQLGHEQAQCLAQRIELDHLDAPITAVYSTPLTRAVQTATPVAQALGLEVSYLDTWRYTDYGSADGRTWREVYDAFPHEYRALHQHVPLAAGAEPPTVFRATVEQAITDLVALHPGEHVVAVGSTENVMAATESLLGLAPEARATTKVAIDHTGITTWDLRPAPWSSTTRRAILVRHNDSAHLPDSQRHSRFRAIPTVGS